MKNTLKIKNFLIFSDVEIEIKRFTVLIGPQASGKSIIAKLLYLFYNFPEDVYIAVNNGDMKRKICDSMLKKFMEIFPKSSWSDRQFQIVFETEFGTLSFSYETGKALSFSISDYYDNMLRRFFFKYKKIVFAGKNEARRVNAQIKLNQSILNAEWGMIVRPENNVFIPAGRSFFSCFDQNMFTLLFNNIRIEYFLKAFGVYYEQCRNNIPELVDKPDCKQKDLDIICKQFLHGTYFRKNKKDYIQSSIGKKSFITEVRDSSSGQQELLPILLTVQTTDSSFLILEEPEAHIYPESQYALIQYLVKRQNRNVEDYAPALLVTTHSPYVLTAVNNLAYAGALSAKLLAADKTDDWKKLGEIYSQDERIPDGELAAYLVKDGKVKNIIDSETGLINAEDLDGISDIINDKFSDLLALSLDNEKSASEE